MKNIILALLLLTAAGCYNEKVQVRSYIEKTTGRAQESRELGRAFGLTMGPWFTGQRVNIDKLKRQFETADKMLKEIHSEILGLRCPNNKLALAYQKELLSYLDWEEEMFASELTIVCNTIENNNPADLTTTYTTYSKLQSYIEEASERAKRLRALASKAANQW